MPRRRSRARFVRGKPNYMWIASSGSVAQVLGVSERENILQPGDWSGTNTETKCTLLRLVLTFGTYTGGGSGTPHRSNYVIGLGDASTTDVESADIDNVGEWPDFMERHDRIFHIGTLEWEGSSWADQSLPVQFSQLPEPVVNLKTPRRLDGSDSVSMWVGGGVALKAAEANFVNWFARSLVRVGLL